MQIKANPQTFIAGRGGRKLDDVRDKYQKACRKLHLTHNEYVLSITEAIEVERDFRTVLLPGLLEHQQSVQESFILLWKNILQEAAQHTDLTSDKFMDIQRRINTAMNSINPTEEYREFTERHKTLPATPFNFQFDESLIEDIPGKLHSNTLTVDNLTVDWLRTRLLELELSVKECQEKQFKMIEHVNGGSPITNGSILTNGNNTNLHANKENRQSKDLNSLRCQEKQKQKLVDMIKCALNEVGCEELPSGCDDHLSLEQSFIENGFDQNQQSTTNTESVSASVSIINELRRRGGVLTLWRGRPFKRKSTPQPATPTQRAGMVGGLKLKLQPRSQSLGSLSVKTNSNQQAKYEPITNPLRMAASVEANHCYGLHVDSEFDDIGTVIVFRKGKDKDKQLLPRLRRTQASMLCLDEETILTRHQTSNINHHDHQTNNNNNIYADLEINCKNNALGDSESLKSDEVHVLTRVEIEINALDKNETFVEDQNGNPAAAVVLALDAQPLNSIDRYLDKIDTLNRVLDDRFKRQLPSLPTTQQQQQAKELDSLNTIEIADNSEIVKRAKDSNSASSKRTSSSSSDSRFKELSSQVAVHNKKRSLSFSQKSINAIFTNIKEFSKSPLSRIHKSHSHPLTESNLENKQGFILEENISIEKQQQVDSKCSENTNESGIATDSEALTNSSTVQQTKSSPANNSNKSKFKVPKIQKKSKAIRNTFRNKIINFQMKRGKFCKICKKRRRMLASKSMFDFSRDTNSIETASDDFCACPNELTPKRQRRAYTKRARMVTTATNTDRCIESTASSLDMDDDELGSDDTSSFKDHCYCVPSLSTSVSALNILNACKCIALV